VVKKSHQRLEKRQKFWPGEKYSNRNKTLRKTKQQMKTTKPKLDELTRAIQRKRKLRDALDAEILRLTNESLKRFHATRKKHDVKVTERAPLPTDAIKVRWVK
jgi:hypothetical protein